MIYLLTYDRPHRKTQDLLYQLKICGVDLTVLVTPWVTRANHKPLFVTKPAPYSWNVNTICDELGYDVEWINSPEDAKLFEEVVVVGGAGILSKYFVCSNTVVNSHCGYLPFVRGLDSLKWAIYYDQPIGVTTHVIDENCDAGRMIERKEVPLYPQDSLFLIAMRQYEMELNMLVNSIVQKTYKNTRPFPESAYEPTRRMPHSTELQMIERLKTRLANLNG